MPTVPNKVRSAGLILLSFILLTGALSGCAQKPAVPSPTAAASPSSAGLYINLDSQENSLPSRFRRCDTGITAKTGDTAGSLDGLKDLKMSGSGQFSVAGLTLLRDELNAQPLYIVDLRQESHGFLNGIAISYMDAANKANKGLSPEQVTADEQAKLLALKTSGTAVLKGADSPVKVESVTSEEDLVKRLGLQYVRFPVTNNESPTDDVVDTFIAFATSLPRDAWLHFHCAEGIGRTTLFMVMYDAMKNAKTVSLEDIMNRQVLLGGKNLLQSKDDRGDFLRAFYKYCSENKDGFQTAWSAWKKSNH